MENEGGGVNPTGLQHTLLSFLHSQLSAQPASGRPPLIEVGRLRCLRGAASWRGAHRLARARGVLDLQGARHLDGVRLGPLPAAGGLFGGRAAGVSAVCMQRVRRVCVHPPTCAIQRAPHAHTLPPSLAPSPALSRAAQATRPSSHATSTPAAHR